MNLTAALLLGSGFVHAQAPQPLTGKGKVTGAVLDEKSQPFPFVNVLLLQAKDSVLVKGLAADEQGKFAFDQIAAGKYLTLISMVGYQKAYSEPFNVKDAPVNLPTVSLKSDIKSLSEVTVVAKKPFIEQEIDRTVVNVENSIVSAGATALEVLERAPGVGELPVRTLRSIRQLAGAHHAVPDVHRQSGSRRDHQRLLGPRPHHR